MADEISHVSAPLFQSFPGKPVAGSKDQPLANISDSFVKASGPSGRAFLNVPGSIVENSGATKLTSDNSPWEEIEKLGLLHSAAAVPGPVGEGLAESARRGLLEVVTRLQGKGVCFERRRLFRIPLAMEKYVPATAEEVVDAFSQDGANKRIAYSRAPGPVIPYEKWLPEKHVPLGSLEEMRGLDGVYGTGVEALISREKTWMEAANDLIAANWQFGTDFEPCTFDRTLFKPCEVLRALREGRQLYIARRSDRSCIRLDPDDLPVMVMLETGRDCGVKSLDIVRNIIALRDGGANTGHQTKGAELELYRSLCQGHPIRLGRATGATMPLGPPGISDTKAVLARLRLLDDLYEQYLSAPLHRTINGQDYHLVYDFCMETGTRFSPHVRAAALRDLFPAASNRHGCVDMSFLFELTRRLEACATDELDLKRIAREYVADVFKKAPRYPGEMQELPPDKKPGGAQPEPGHLRMLEIYRKFLEAAQSEGAATEGLDLVRMPAGNESEDQRVRLFIDLAEASTEDNRKKTADAYRALFSHRRPGQSLSDAGCLLIKLLKYLGSCNQQDRALDVFAELQEANSQNPGNDEMLAAFAKSLVTSGSVEDALKAARTAGENSDGASAQQSIDTGEGIVVIGGISLRLRDTEEKSSGDEALRDEHPSAPVRNESPPAVSKPPIMSRDEIDRFLGEGLKAVINRRDDLEPIYDHLMKPSLRFSPQARAAALLDLIPSTTSSSGYLEVRELLDLINRIEKRPDNDTELAWLVRNYLGTVNERHGPYGTDAEGPKGPHIRTPQKMFEELVRQNGGGELAVIYMTTTRPKVRKWLADKLVENGDLSVAHTKKERVRETRASLLRQLEDATGSSAAGADAFNLLSISIGKETEEERLKLFLDLVGADRGEQAPCHYKAILMYRHPEQDLLDAGKRYLDVLKALSAGNMQDRSTEVFVALQQAPPGALAVVTRRLSRGSTVEEALAAIKGERRETIEHTDSKKGDKQ